MRGTRVPLTLILNYLRIIPAHAGNTVSGNTFKIPFPDHPRSCGEHVSDLERTIKEAGSSPLMRGTLGVEPDVVTYPGIIPAHAGNTGLGYFLLLTC